MGAGEAMRGTLKSKPQFVEVYEKGLKAVGRHVVAFALPRVPDPAERAVGDERAVAIGFVASRKVGGAVARARAKRVLRAAMQPLRSSVRPATWIVLVARSSLIAERTSSSQLCPELAELLERLEALEGSPTFPPGPGS